MSVCVVSSPKYGKHFGRFVRCLSVLRATNTKRSLLGAPDMSAGPVGRPRAQASVHRERLGARSETPRSSRWLRRARKVLHATSRPSAGRMTRACAECTRGSMRNCASATRGACACFAWRASASRWSARCGSRAPPLSATPRRRGSTPSAGTRRRRRTPARGVSRANEPRRAPAEGTRRRRNDGNASTRPRRTKPRARRGSARRKAPSRSWRTTRWQFRSSGGR